MNIEQIEAAARQGTAPHYSQALELISLIKRQEAELAAARAPAVVEQVDALTGEQIVDEIDRPGFAWENLSAERRNLLGSIRAVIAATRQAAPVQVPDDVQQALDRMCQPLDESRLKGATAECDARCMAILKRYIELTASPVQAAPEVWQLVPRIATLGMMAAGRDAASKIPKDEPLAKAEVTYKAMLAAAPAPGGAK